MDPEMLTQLEGENLGATRPLFGGEGGAMGYFPHHLPILRVPHTPLFSIFHSLSHILQAKGQACDFHSSSAKAGSLRFRLSEGFFPPLGGGTFCMFDCLFVCFFSPLIPNIVTQASQGRHCLAPDLSCSRWGRQVPCVGS